MLNMIWILVIFLFEKLKWINITEEMQTCMTAVTVRDYSLTFWYGDLIVQLQLPML